MPTATANYAGRSEVALLARVLGNGHGQLPAAMARNHDHYIHGVPTGL